MPSDSYLNKTPATQARGYDQVIDFFNNIGLSREASMYVKMFRNIVPWQFTVVLISAESLKRSSRTVALDLSYLCGLGLYPVIVLDNFQAAVGNLVKPLEDLPVKKSTQGGLIRKLTLANNRLVNAVSASGGRATSIYNEIFSLKTPVPKEPDFDFRLLVDYIDLAPIKSTVRNQHIPVISPLVMDSSGRMGMALSFSRGIMSNPNDQLMIALISFKEDHQRWPGVPHNPKEDGPNPPPKGWTYFPGADRLAKAQKWLNDRGASANSRLWRLLIRLMSFLTLP